MRRKKHKAPAPKQLCIRYDAKVAGWVVDGAPKALRPFATKMDAENYCIQKLHQCPVTAGAQQTHYQDLPQSSVWTGAPWDKTFKYIR